MANLKKGAKGKAVAQLQTALNKNGASPKLKVDEVFGPVTETAVKAFQKKKKLKADGVAEDVVLFALGIGPRPASLTLKDINDSIKEVQGTLKGNAATLSKRLKEFGQAAAGTDKLKDVLLNRQKMYEARQKDYLKVLSGTISTAKKKQDALMKEYQKTKDPDRIKKLIAAMAKTYDGLYDTKLANEITDRANKLVADLKLYQNALSALKSKIEKE